VQAVAFWPIMPVMRSHQLAKRGEIARRRREALREAEIERAKKIEAECDSTFREADSNGSGTLEPVEVRALITSITQQTYSDAIYQQLVGFALDQFPGQLDACISREQFPKLLSAARSYAAQHEVVDNLLSKHDVDRSGELDLREFISALQDVSPDSIRVRAGDVLWLLSKCDMDGDRRLTFSELMPAVGLWRDLAGPLDSLDDEDDDADADEDRSEAILDAVCAGLETSDSAEEHRIGTGASFEDLPPEGVELADKAFIAADGSALDGVDAESLTRMLIEGGMAPTVVHTIIMGCEVGEKGKISREALRKAWSKVAAAERRGMSDTQRFQTSQVMIAGMPMVANDGFGSTTVGQNDKQPLPRPSPPTPKRTTSSKNQKGMARGMVIGAQQRESTGRKLSGAVSDPAESKPAHRLDGAVILKKGVSKSYVKTHEGKCLVVDNAELVKAERAIAKACKESVREGLRSEEGEGAPSRSKSSACSLL